MLLLVNRLELGRRDVPERREQPAGVEPIDPLERGAWRTRPPPGCATARLITSRLRRRASMYHERVRGAGGPGSRGARISRSWPYRPVGSTCLLGSLRPTLVLRCVALVDRTPMKNPERTARTRRSTTEVGPRTKGPGAPRASWGGRRIAFFFLSFRSDPANMVGSRSTGNLPNEGGARSFGAGSGLPGASGRCPHPRGGFAFLADARIDPICEADPGRRRTRPATDP